MYSHDPHVTADQLARLRRLFGLDAPLWRQYVNWLIQATRGNFGYSFYYGEPAVVMMWQRAAATATLMGSAFAAAVTVSFIVGVMSAVRRYSIWDHLVTVVSYAGVSLPTFWVGLMAIVLFAVDLHWLPAGGVGSGGATQDLGHLILPASVLASSMIANESRYVRSP